MAEGRKVDPLRTLRTRPRDRESLGRFFAVTVVVKPGENVPVSFEVGCDVLQATKSRHIASLLHWVTRFEEHSWSLMTTHSDASPLELGD